MEQIVKDITAWFYAASATFRLRLFHVREGMPMELRRGRLVLSETTLFTSYPVPLVGKPDQVFENDRGLLVPTDTKTRARATVYLRDMIQLSVYRVLLACSEDRRLPHGQVAPYGYMRLVVRDEVIWVQVKLLSTSFVVKVWFEYWRRRERRVA